MSKAKLKRAHNWFYQDRGFRWESDFNRLGTPEHWQILKSTKGVFVGDCEDAALTIMNRLILDGVGESSLSIVRCATEVCPPGVSFDHAVLAFIDGKNWLFSDNRFYKFPAATRSDLRGYTFYDSVSIANLRGAGSPMLFIN
jgi:predicted transglutaminase-like cysteine proteinase